MTKIGRPKEYIGEMKAINIKITKSDHDKLKRISFDTHVSIQKQVTILINGYLKKEWVS